LWESSGLGKIELYIEFRILITLKKTKKLGGGGESF